MVQSKDSNQALEVSSGKDKVSLFVINVFSVAEEVNGTVSSRLDIRISSV